jgi:hypothetical protein
MHHHHQRSGLHGSTMITKWEMSHRHLLALLGKSSPGPSMTATFTTGVVSAILGTTDATGTCTRGDICSEIRHHHSPRQRWSSWQQRHWWGALGQRQHYYHFHHASWWRPWEAWPSGEYCIGRAWRLAGEEQCW